MRVAVYARVSRADKDDPRSIPQQIADCERYARDEGHEVVATFVDQGVSAYDTSKQRPEYLRMLTALEAGEVETVLARDTERLLRQDKEGARWLEMGAAGTVRKILFADEDPIDFTKARSREAFKIRVAGAVAYSERLGEKLRSTVIARAQSGYWTTRKPFGYRVVPADPRRPDGPKTLEVDEREAGLLRRAVRDILNGRPARDICREWGSPPWTPSSLRRVLTSPAIAGLRRHRGLVVGKGAWPALVDRRTFEAIQTLFADPARSRYRSRGEQYPLTGLLRCREHGGMVGSPRGCGVSRKRYYYCPKGEHLRIVAEPLEEYVVHECELRTVPVVDVLDPRAVAEGLLERRDDVDARISRWHREAAVAGLSAAEIADGRAGLVEERDRLDGEIAAVTTSRKSSWEDVYGIETTDTRAFVRARVARIVVRPAVDRARHDPVGRAEIIWRDGVRTRQQP